MLEIGTKIINIHSHETATIIDNKDSMHVCEYSDGSRCAYLQVYILNNFEILESNILPVGTKIINLKSNESATIVNYKHGHYVYRYLNYFEGSYSKENLFKYFKILKAKNYLIW